MDDRSSVGIERLQQNMVLEALVREQLATITLDIDGSVLGTCRHACPRAKIELRMDGAFFSEHIIECLDELGVEYSISVPFERYPTTIKCYIEQRKRWWRLRKGAKYFDKKIALDSWNIAPHRFLFVRDRHKEQSKGVVQLDLFKPHDFNYRYKVIITNKTTNAKHVVQYHEGRGSQEGLFAELKTEAAMSYVPCNGWNANQLFLLSNVIAHNLTRELQMRYRERDRNTTVKRPALWKFSKIGTLRKQIIQRAGRLIRHKGILTLSMPKNLTVEKLILSYLPS